MSYTPTTHSGNGSLTTFAIGFPFLRATDVQVFLSDVLQTFVTDYVISGSDVVFVVAPPSGTDNIEFRRATSRTASVVDFVGGARISEANLDDLALQAVYIAQEVDFAVGDGTGIDASVAAAAASAAAASTSETNAATSETNAATSETNAATSETNAAASAAAAAVSEANAAAIAGGTTPLDSLQDVNAPSPTDGFVLTWVNASSEWQALAAGGGVSAIDDLSDVDTTTSPPSTGEHLEWDGSNWVPGAGFDGAINDLSDVIITAAADEQLLRYDGTNWRNASDAGPTSAFTSLFSRPTADVLNINASEVRFGVKWVGFASFNKALDNSGGWVAGFGNNGLPVAVSLSTNTWYHAFAMYNASTGATDLGFDSSILGTNLSAAASGWTVLYVMSVFRNGSGDIRPFLNVEPGVFWWDVPELDVNLVSSTGGTQTFSNSIPPDVQGRAMFNVFTPTATDITVHHPSLNWGTPSSTAAPLGHTSGTSGGFGESGFNASQQMDVNAPIAADIRVSVHGWKRQVVV